jgi:hypothetical protein
MERTMITMNFHSLTKIETQLQIFTGKTPFEAMKYTFTDDTGETVTITAFIDDKTEIVKLPDWIQK